MLSVESKLNKAGTTKMKKRTSQGKTGRGKPGNRRKQAVYAKTTKEGALWEGKPSKLKLLRGGEN